MKVTEKWPCTINITRVLGSKINEELACYLITGVMNKNQMKTLQNRMPLHSTIEAPDNSYMIASLITHNQLQSLYKEFEELSRNFRGQYQSVAIGFVKAYQEGKIADFV